MRKVKILATSSVKPETYEEFNEKKRWRSKSDETQLDLAEKAANLVLEKSKLTINDIHCIVSASAVYMQPIPCNGALIHERIAKGSSIPSFDINSTCTSFITALDTMSYLIDSKRYKNILIISSDIPSWGLNPNEKESFELFSDAASAVIITFSDDSSSILHSTQGTWSEGAHDTEILAGGTLQGPSFYNDKNKEQYQFHMNGLKVLRLVHKKTLPFIKSFLNENNINPENIDLIIPHQASPALDIMMKKLGFDKNKYINIVNEYGNMVSASIPFTLDYAITNNLIKRGDKILLMGTAAGLTANAIYLVY